MFWFTALNFHKLSILPVPHLSTGIPQLVRGMQTVVAWITRTSRVMTLFIVVFLCLSAPTFAATAIPFTINLSKAVNVTGTPRIAVDVGGVTRYATYASGTGTSALTFTYSMVAGDIDLDGVTVSSPIDLNGGTIKDLSGNDLSPLTFTPPNTTNVKVNYPSLGIDFIYDADGRYTLNGTPYNDLTSFLSATGGTFTRASIGTYFDSAGTLQTAASGAPRFDYDPVTHAAKGILIEESRANLLDQSDDIFTYTGTQTSTTTLDNVALAPDGTMKADSISSSGGGWRGKNYTFTTGTTYTFSLWVWVPSGTQTFQLNLFNGASNQSSAVMTATTIPTRYVHTVTTTSGGGGNVVIYPPAGSSTFYVWGWQLEQGAFPTSYIPTTTAAVTRAADVLSVPTGGWSNAVQGGIFSSFDTGINGSNKLVYRWGSGAGSIGPYAANNTIRVDKAALGTIFTQSGSFTGNGLHALAYDASGTYGSFNGGTVGSSTQTSQASPLGLYIGSESTPANILNGHVQKLKYYPVRVSDTQLQLLTQ